MRRLTSQIGPPRIASGLLLLLAAAPAWTAVTGSVTSLDGIPVENARVSAPDGETRYTDFKGAFAFPDLDIPSELSISHPRFLQATVEIVGPVVDVRLEAKQEIYQEIAVSAAPGESSYAPSSSSASVIDVGAMAAAPATLTEVVVSSPSVAENGQGGIFQTYSIRGVARQRVLTLLAGMRLVGERRAGVSASFIDPRLMGKVDVLRGPASTYYGSGALGGVIQMFPRTFEGTTTEIGYESNGAGSHQVVGWGDGAWSLGFAHRSSETGETPDGLTLNDGFDQTSATLSRAWSHGERDYSVLVLASRGTDIGKSNTDFPGRVTLYPEERHLLLKFAVRSEKGWGFDAWAHPNDLETRVLRDGRETTTRNKAVDLGFNWRGRRQWSQHASLRFGVDYFGRRKVEAIEVSQPLDGRAGPTFLQMPLDGSEDELGIYGAFERNWSGTVLLLGGRLALQRQREAETQRRDDAAWTGFAGLVVPLSPSFELAANLGSGLRFPSLSERFFTGFTPRGFVDGNIELEAERSLSTDLALRYYGNKLFLSFGAFRTRVEDYIERIEVATDELTFVNLTAGDLIGLELDGAYRLSGEWSLGFGGHALEGRGDRDVPLADVPADRVFLRSRWRRGHWSVEDRWEHRFDKNDPGRGEKAIGAADLLSGAVSYQLPNGLALVLAGKNLLDEEYFNSADEKMQLARGRSVTLTLAWRG
ncbi:MAG: TonB-dependent receptor [Acidobacteria bacterium]|nr:TonB-dependent receptor [Acidobacteriota bacterium]